MRVLYLVAVPIWFFSCPLFSSSVHPPLGNPIFDNGQGSANSIAHSPEIKVVHHHDLSKKVLVPVVVASSLVGGILLLLSCFTIYRLKRLRTYSNATNDINSGSAKGISLIPFPDNYRYSKFGSKKGSVASIDYQMLVIATNNFDEGKLLGEGGLGRVYKACFSDNFEAAVKKICADWQEAQRQYENEVQILSKIQHQNIVSLLGYCVHEQQRFLIYEMMEGGSLDLILHAPSRRSTLTWPLRMKIALDVARGLEHLHEHCDPPVIHRDLKSSNILLDSNFNAKISDFGLAITEGNSIKTNIKLTGTLGYVAPEYLLDGKLTDKSDVYAFGVILLELLMGRRPVEKVESQCQSIVTWATPQLMDKSKLPDIVDQSIKDTIDLKHLYQVAAIAVLCVQPEASYRPLIADVLHSFIPLVPVQFGGSLKG
ncbi:protein kinase superfamily protein [Striga asiatica]|uniref:Protein kinase superfamily protein n=1 Tax=Striga asiatica TaxID=4170 RepID=A0A5A7Q4I6_STRAF|nr:protein kinase superfamily protein [Striga asiatica]